MQHNGEVEIISLLLAPILVRDVENQILK